MEYKSAFPVIVTSKVAEARDIYVEHLGFTVVFEADWYVQLHAPRAGGGKPIELAFVQPNQESQPPPLHVQWRRRHSHARGGRCRCPLSRYPRHRLRNHRRAPGRAVGATALPRSGSGRKPSRRREADSPLVRVRGFLLLTGCGGWPAARFSRVRVALGNALVAEPPDSGTSRAGWMIYQDLAYRCESPLVFDSAGTGGRLPVHR